MIKGGYCKIDVPDVENLYIAIEGTKEERSAKVIVQGKHTNIIRIEKDNEVIFEKEEEFKELTESEFSFDEIYNFAKPVIIRTLPLLLDMQIEYNSAIGKEGIENSYGANIEIDFGNPDDGKRRQERMRRQVLMQE